jgi:YD repeat-containing protein
MGDTILTRHYTLDAKGDEVRAEFWRKENNLRAVKETTYDAQRRPLVTKELENGEQQWEERYTHVGQTRLEADRFNAQGELDRHFVLEFDAQGHCTHMEQSDAQGNRVMLLRKTYNENGRLVREENVSAQDQVLGSTAFTYDAQGMQGSIVSEQGPQRSEIRYENRYYQR